MTIEIETETVTILSAGDVLRDAREASGIDLSTVSAALNMSSAKLEALESNHFESLVAPAYIRGYLRSYGRWLGIDPEPLVRWYDQEHAPSSSSGSSHPEAAPQPMREPIEKPHPEWTWPIVIGAMALICWGGYALWSTGEKNEIPLAAASISPELVVSDTVPQSTTPSPSQLSNLSNSVSVKEIERRNLVPNQQVESFLAEKVTQSGTHQLSTSSDGGGTRLQPDKQNIAGDEVFDGVVVDGAVIDVAAGKTEVNEGVSEAQKRLAPNPDPVGRYATGETLANAASHVEMAPATLDAESQAAIEQARRAQIDAVERSIWLEFSDDCWLEVKDAYGDSVYAGLRAAGGSLVLSGFAPFEFMFGNVHAVQSFAIDDEPISLTPRGTRNTLRVTLPLSR
ncbi:RodZ domain-containing protein [Marinibactrum halimedae]|uniref:Cytoskeleton protein RodZ-like C-terminal domain-containing protein n=1 Tax=Marinibactrum halimedae TaxID=1444977 RepID=A0AA37T5P9_9GAMM|nr:RodZ domain-containing protein [Marinibactrum halimedae]MCD9458433.1 DUF4115 domain-containing protein [Marinibactrum halimedae]GLS26131.1 hypothetical protein GCM10007877_18460 [Marinibactrum halimedae]